MGGGRNVRSALHGAHQKKRRELAGRSRAALSSSHDLSFHTILGGERHTEMGDKKMVTKDKIFTQKG